MLGVFISTLKIRTYSEEIDCNWILFPLTLWIISSFITADTLKFQLVSFLNNPQRMGPKHINGWTILRKEWKQSENNLVLSRHIMIRLLFSSVWSCYVPSQVSPSALLYISVSCPGFLNHHLAPTYVSGWAVGRADWHGGFSAVFLSGYLRTQRGTISPPPLSVQELTPLEISVPGELMVGAGIVSCPSDCLQRHITELHALGHESSHLG